MAKKQTEICKWKLTSESDPRWNGTGETTEDPFLWPPEVLAHLRFCREKYGPHKESMCLEIRDGDAGYGKYCTSDTPEEVDAILAEQRPVPPLKLVKTLGILELQTILETDYYRQGPSFRAAGDRLHNLAMKLPKMGYFNTHSKNEALSWVPPDPMSEAERVACIWYLRAGKPGVYWKGWASCRICGKRLGDACNVTPDSKWLYPAQWEHYIKEHGLRPPETDIIQDALLWAMKENLIVMMNRHEYTPRYLENLQVHDIESRITGAFYVVVPGVDLEKAEPIGTK